MPSELTLVILLTILVTTAPELYSRTPILHVCRLLKKQLDHSLIPKPLPVSPFPGAVLLRG